jgi:hypothetical protein
MQNSNARKTVNHKANGEENHLIAEIANPFLELYLLTKTQFVKIIIFYLKS